MLLTQYQRLTRRLVNDPTFALINDFDLRDYINIGRAQVAADGECVRTNGSANITGGTAVIPLSQLALAANPGLSQALVARNATLNGVLVDVRPWDWFVVFDMNNPASTPVMAHQGQGSFTNLYISSLSGGSLWVDVVALPVDLVDDTTPDAIPFPWVDAVAFYAVYYAYMSAQQQQEADNSMMRYRDMMRRARGETTSTYLPENDPGGVGARIATTKVPLGALPPAAPAPPRGRVVGR